MIKPFPSVHSVSLLAPPPFSFPHITNTPLLLAKSHVRCTTKDFHFFHSHYVTVERAARQNKMADGGRVWSGLELQKGEFVPTPKRRFRCHLGTLFVTLSWFFGYSNGTLVSLIINCIVEEIYTRVTH